MSKPVKITVVLLTTMMISTLFPLTFSGAGANYGASTDIAEVDASFINNVPNDYLGSTNTASSRGDVNGDGYGDLLIGHYLGDGAAVNSGTVFLIFGKTSGWTMDMPVNNADVIFNGENSNDLFGYTLAITGDINGDGFDDIVIGAGFYDGAGVNRGQVYIFFGHSGAWPATISAANANATIVGEANDDYFGEHVGDAGDINGDGLDDIVVGAYGADLGWAGSTSGTAYVYFGRTTGWAKGMAASSANASFNAENKNDWTGGYSVGAGDVNADGYDDLLIASLNGQVNGKVYLFFGKPSGWQTGVNLSQADASFIGERPDSWAGYTSSSEGDLNYDGFDDIVIGAGWDSEPGSYTGQVYIIFGKASGWAKNMSLSNADASIIGPPNENSLFGWPLSVGGDVNGDGIDDLLVGAPTALVSGVRHGILYLYLGKTAGWTKDAAATTADAMFIGGLDDYLGAQPVITEDLNGDGLDDIGVASPNNDTAATYGGAYFIIFYDTNKPPTAITSVKAYQTADYMNETAYALQGDTIYVELQGTDGNASRKDVAIVKVKSDQFPVGMNVVLYETGLATGIYRGSFIITDRTHKDYNWIAAGHGESVEISSFTEPTNKAIVTIGGIEMSPKDAPITILEDSDNTGHFVAVNVTDPVWEFETNASWLEWNGTTQNISGTPDNTNIGVFYAHIFAYDHLGRYDDHNMSVTVENVPPMIETVAVTEATEDSLYEVDYNSSDDGQGVITWSLATDASSWLAINETTGVLSGLPINGDVGDHYVNITVDDGNGGTNFTNFTLTVVNSNDGPGITTADILTATEDVLYSVNYTAADVDAGDVLTWAISTDAGAWLTINASSGMLSGTPTNADVGQHYVNVTVKDATLASDYTNFTLTVVNTEDAPVWKDVPSSATIDSLGTYTFDVNATDVDMSDTITYGITVTPLLTAAHMNKSTGKLTITEPPAGVYILNLSATDAQMTIYHNFELNVTFKNSAPTVTLDSPANNATVATAKPTLEWTTSDRDGDLIKVDLYVSDVKADVDGKVASARVLTASSTALYLYTTYLTPGKTYYWTVVPNDGTVAGTCVNGTIAFTVSSSAKVNHKPTIAPPAKVKDAPIGKTYKMTVAGADTDAGTTLTYSLTGHPAGMSISPTTGEISWKPTKSQKGTHTFNVVVSDGEFTASTPVTVKVVKAPEAGVNSMLVPIIVIIIIVVVIVLILAATMGKKKDEGTGDEGSDEDVDKEGDEEE